MGGKGAPKSLLALKLRGLEEHREDSRATLPGPGRHSEDRQLLPSTIAGRHARSQLQTGL